MSLHLIHAIISVVNRRLGTPLISMMIPRSRRPLWLPLLGWLAVFLARNSTCFAFHCSPKIPCPPVGVSLGAAHGFASSSAPKKNTGYTGAKALRRSANNYDKLRKSHGDQHKMHGRDVYVRSTLHSKTTFWFVGKVVRQDDSISMDQVINIQKRLILDYSRHELRPQNFAGKYQAGLELWMAPADSEMDTGE